MVLVKQDKERGGGKDCPIYVFVCAGVTLNNTFSNCICGIFYSIFLRVRRLVQPDMVLQFMVLSCEILPYMRLIFTLGNLWRIYPPHSTGPWTVCCILSRYLWLRLFYGNVNNIFSCNLCCSWITQVLVIHVCGNWYPNYQIFSKFISWYHQYHLYSWYTKKIREWFWLWPLIWVNYLTIIF